MADRIRATVDGLIQVAGSPLAYTCAETLRQLFDNAEAMLPDFRIKKSGETRIFAPLRPEDLRRSTQQAMDVDAPPEMAPTGPRGMATGMAMANPFDQAASAFLLRCAAPRRGKGKETMCDAVRTASSKSTRTGR